MSTSKSVSALRAELRAAIQAEATDHRKKLGARLRDIREVKNMTQVQLAQLVSLERSSIAKIEAGTQNLTVASLIEIAIALEVPASSFLERIEEEVPDEQA